MYIESTFLILTLHECTLHILYYNKQKSMIKSRNYIEYGRRCYILISFLFSLSLIFRKMIELIKNTTI